MSPALPRAPLARAALRPAAWLFRGAVAGRNLLFDLGWRRAARLPVPVVSVGNLAVGGTGKTPLVAWLARRLAAAGRRPVIVSRGYGGVNERRPGRPPLLVSGGSDAGEPPLAVTRGMAGAAAEAGDEAVLLASLLPDVPVVVCPRRAAGAGLALERCGADLVLLDDGFQHRVLARDVDLVTLDAADPWAGGRLLPAGGLREPPGSLRRAHAVILTRAADRTAAERAGEAVARVAPGTPVFLARHRPVRLHWPGRPDPGQEPAILAGVPVAAFAGLARPDDLRATLTALGAEVVAFTARTDHAPYGPGEVEELVRAGLAAGARWVITTAKDAVRMAPDARPAALGVLEISLEVEQGATLLQRVLDLCLPGARGVVTGEVEPVG